MHRFKQSQRKASERRLKEEKEVEEKEEVEEEKEVEESDILVSPPITFEDVIRLFEDRDFKRRRAIGYFTILLFFVSMCCYFLFTVTHRNEITELPFLLLGLCFLWRL